MQKNKVGVIVKTKDTGNYILASATKQDNGKYWYTYCEPDIIGKYESCSAKHKEVNDIANNLAVMNLLNK